MGTYDLNHVENLERGLTQPQAERLEKVRQNLALSLAREYGSRLSTIMAEKLVREVILRPEVLAHLEGATVVELPSDANGWGRWAREAVSRCELSQRSLAASDDDLRERLKNEVLAEIPRARKMAMARDAGTLDSFVLEQVAQRFEWEISKGYGHGAV
ncbi:hypothetical protein M8756_01925 [Lutimaribacter sp. EGI FJ00015]|uniref:Uncharacterized protein n=1 Tax=Lutimaribacter degradans TaxID=2945989 RepID=A0ACC5ZSI8_9RHOB|nr:hypothetical protein [Lutimaribacter sp. EGI FJ00013]MCM2561001.1 hypothetical protein [Lutimaribacter sp. EGI FJ00013]MCO0612052.1 hypothetical protein [Lutimaribacter sp. EGI FJ00015]MCO0634828.1 hypothetical protein [Lutimaribacter sp. EGI FJ00014]